MVAGLGVEPRFADYEPAVIPIHFPATFILQVGFTLGKWAVLLRFLVSGRSCPQLCVLFYRLNNHLPNFLKGKAKHETKD